MLKAITFSFLCFLTALVAGQDIKPKDSTEVYYVRMSGDSLLTKSIELEDVYLFGKLECDNKE